MCHRAFRRMIACLSVSGEDLDLVALALQDDKESPKTNFAQDDACGLRDLPPHPTNSNDGGMTYLV
jgi:hypothetical protein